MKFFRIETRANNGAWHVYETVSRITDALECVLDYAAENKPYHVRMVEIRSGSVYDVWMYNSIEAIYDHFASV